MRIRQGTIKEFLFENMIVGMRLNTARMLLWTVGIIFMTFRTGWALPGWLKGALQLKCDMYIDQGASAVILMKTGDVEFSRGGHSHSRTRVVYRILSHEGEDFGILSIPYFSRQKVKVKGWVIHPDGDSESLKKKGIMVISPHVSAGYYDDSQFLVAALPHVQPGDIAAFEFKTDETGWTGLFHSFVFQLQQPVVYARYTVKVPDGWKIKWSEWNMDGIHREWQAGLYTWSAKNLPFRPDEPLSPSKEYLSSRLFIYCFDPEGKLPGRFTDWNSAADWVSRLFRTAVQPSGKIFDQSWILTKTASTTRQKVRAVAEFVRDEIRYVAIEIGKNRWEPRSATTTLSNRYGDCKDKTTLMCALLAACGVYSIPALASVGMPVDPSFPSPLQFNHCIIAIPLNPDTLPSELLPAVVGHFLLYDPTDPSSRLGEIPSSLRGNFVLIGAEGDSVLFKIPRSGPHSNRRLYRLKASLGVDGSMSADVTVIDCGSWASQTRYACSTEPKKQRMDSWRSILSANLPGLVLSDYRERVSLDSVSTSFSIETRPILQRSGKRYILLPDPFHSESRFPPLSAGERHNPIWFGPAMEITTDILWHLPKGWWVESIPASLKHQCGGASISWEGTAMGSNIHIVTCLEVVGKLMPPGEYEAACRFSRGLDVVRSQRILIHKQQEGEGL